MLDELAVFNDTDSAELTAARDKHGPRPFGDKPLVILTAADQTAPGLTPDEIAALHTVWIALHDEMAALSSRGVNRTVEGSSHYIHQLKPQVVVDAVAEVVDQVRAGKH